LVGLSQNGIQRFSNKVGAVIGGYDYGNQWRCGGHRAVCLVSKIGKKIRRSENWLFEVGNTAKGLNG